MKPETTPPEPTIETRLLPLARRFYPGLGTARGQELTSGIANVVGLLYAAPLALVGMGWLVAVTDLALVRREWPAFLLLLVLVFLLRRLGFFLFLEIKAGSYFDWPESLETIVTWSAALLFGPTALWLVVIWAVISYFFRWRQSVSTSLRWNLARNFGLEITRILAGLIALSLYERWGGVFPLPGLALGSVLPAFYATCVRFVLSGLFWMPILVYYGSSQAFAGGTPWQRMAQTAAIVMALPGLVDPFAILAAGLYAQNGLGAYLFLVAGVLLTSGLAHQLSAAAVRSRQRSRELERLEQLGRAIIDAPSDASTLPEVLREHVPGMFPNAQIEICIFPDQTILHHPPDWSSVPDSVWEWLRTTTEARYFTPGAALPWGGRLADDAPVVAPILDVENGQPIGGIYLCQTWNVEAISNLLPAVQSLAAQIASALHGAEVCRVEQELALAGKIQASFLPRDLPEVPGWQIAATLEPARQTSGDFYDLIPLPNGRLGIVVADVADKGMGAALYMALSRTLIRTYAVQYHARPDYVFRVANRRILMDADAKLFVTVFYGVLDPLTGTLTYCNAGHNPPYLLSGQSGGPIRELRRTGIPLGIFEGETWEHCSVQLAPGDVLWLYTDGVTDAEDGNEEFFGEERLLEAARASVGRSAQGAQDALLAAVHRFVGDAPQFDDITLMVLAREPETRNPKPET